MAVFDGISGITRKVYSASGDATLVAASSGKKIRILALVAYAAGGTTTFETGGGDAILGPVSATTPVVLPFMASGWAETVAGEALNLDPSGSDQNDGVVIYTYV